MAAGGSVFFRYTLVAALSVLLPAHQLAAMAARSDVQGISPNRLTGRTATTLSPSHLELATGATHVRTRSQATSLGCSGLDGSGVGIAVLDSGVMSTHSLMADASGGSRVLSGEALFRQWQPFYDPRLHWVDRSVQRMSLRYWPDTGAAYPMAVLSAPAGNSALVSPGVVSMVDLAGGSSVLSRSGLLMPTATLSSWLSSGKTLGQGIVLSEGVVRSEAGQVKVNKDPTDVKDGKAMVLGEN